MLALVLMMFGAPRAKPVAKNVIVAQRRDFFDRCSYRVLQTLPPEPKNEKIEIVCDERQVLTYDLGVTRSISGFENIDVVEKDNRIILSWERGMTVGVTVIQVSGGRKPGAKVVFEESSRSGVEVLEDGNVLLYHVRRWIREDSTAEIVPKATNVYVWKDGEYRFSGGYIWNENYRFASRYCILDKPEDCPAVRSEKPIEDDIS